MQDGYIKLWRKSISSAVFCDPVMWKLWSLCLLKANHKENFVTIEGITEPIKILPGQFVTGRFALHKEFYPRKKKTQKSPSTLWRMLQSLENMRNLNIKSYTKFTIITITNWSEYQQNEQQLNNNCTTTEQQLNTNKNVKNEKKRTYSVEFEAFWKAYPSKTAKKKAYESWKRMNSNRPSLDVLLKAIENQKMSRKWKEGYIANPATWLNQERWEDEVEIEKEDNGWADLP